MTKKQQLISFLATPTAKLAMTYLAIIMLMSISFSVIFYNTSARQFDRPIPIPGQAVSPMQDREIFNSQVRRVIEQRLRETRQDLLVRLVWINVSTLLVGSGISYILARRSLRPIEEAMEAQSQFISDASHELRTPLTVLQTTNEVALRKKKLPEKSARELIAHNVQEVIKLRDLSNTLLELLKDDRSDIEIKAVDLQTVISDSLGHIVAVAQAKNITINDKVDRVKILSNKKLLSRIVAILLDNAVKYSDSGQTVTLSTEIKGKQVYLKITDNGQGIKASDMPHIFRRFYRADKSRTSNETSSYGLGLAIADKISKRINIKIEVLSEPAKGSTFSLVIPADETKAK